MEAAPYLLLIPGLFWLASAIGGIQHTLILRRLRKRGKVPEPLVAFPDTLLGRYDSEDPRLGKVRRFSLIMMVLCFTSAGIVMFAWVCL